MLIVPLIIHIQVVIVMLLLSHYLLEVVVMKTNNFTCAPQVIVLFIRSLFDGIDGQIGYIDDKHRHEKSSAGTMKTIRRYV